MGGIVVRKFLVERATDLIERKIEIGLLLVASPSLGASYADWLSPLSKFFGNEQAKIADSGRNRPPVPNETGHVFRRKSATNSGVNPATFFPAIRR